MNLDDFSYEENGQRYIKPQIYVDENEAFVNNLRNTQQPNNSEIRQQTYKLGTAIPSNKGSLVGGESYFNARYQTPQTNEVVSNLRATAQAQALQEAMSNELAKAKRRYSNALRAANKQNNNNPYTDPEDENPLDVLTNPDAKDDIVVNENTNTGPGKVDVDSNGSFYTDNDGNKIYFRNPNAAEDIQNPAGLGTRTYENGQIITGANGKKYMYLNNDQYKDTWVIVDGE